MQVKSGVPHGATELGWLPDCVYVGDKFETGVAFFADAVGRITRFSREPADLAIARRLAGQAVLPGLVNAHSHAFHRVLRGRSELRARGERDLRAHALEVRDRVMTRLSAEDVFDSARLVFLEMLLAGITCVGEFHYLHRQSDGTGYADPNALAREVMRAAHDVGIRIALLNVLAVRADAGASPSASPERWRAVSVEQFVRDTEALRGTIEKEFPADEVWLGVAAKSPGHVPLDAFKALATYARAQRFRLHAHVGTTAGESAAWVAEFGRTPLALLSENGIVDKRFTAVDAIHLSDTDIAVLGAARASVCVCPSSEQHFGLGSAPADRLLAAGAGVALGSDGHVQVDMLKEARLLEYGLRGRSPGPASLAGDAVTALFHAATVTGARSLGATSGALEVGRPADFFTVNLFDPSIAGADAGSLLANVLFALERRAIRDVWIGARQRITAGRHPNHGPIVGRFVEMQTKLWGA